MQHQQLQKHEGLVLQMELLCIVASCEHRKYEEVFGMDLWQLKFHPYKSATIKGHTYVTENIVSERRLRT